MKSDKNEAVLAEEKSTVSRVNVGFEEWSHLNLQVRVKMIRRLRKLVSKNARKIGEAVSIECGRPLTESISQEVLPVLEMAKYCEKKLAKRLAPQKLPYRRPGFFRKKNVLFYEPIGPVAIFSPQNFPFSLAMMSLIYAILPGNTVVLKPSEKSALLPSLIEELLRDSGLLEAGVASVVSGDAETGQRLIRNPGIKKIIFFGRRSSGESVARACVSHLKPFVLEMGGGSVAVVCSDANLKQAAAGLAWSSFYSCGQSCISTERILVDEAISGKFVSLFNKKVAEIHLEMMETIRAKGNASYRSDFTRLRDLIADAESKGAEIFQFDSPRSPGDNNVFNFTVILNVQPGMLLATEEIFGPAVVVQSVADPAEALAELSLEIQPMGVSVWSESHKQAHYLAKKVSSGMVWINDTSFGLPHLPWGGWGKAGWGSLFSEFSLQEVTQQKWVSLHPRGFSRPRFWWNPYTSRKEKLMVKIAENFF